MVYLWQRASLTAVFTIIDLVDGGRHKWSSRTGSAVRRFYQLPIPLCLPPAVRSMFLADAVEIGSVASIHRDAEKARILGNSEGKKRAGAVRAPGSSTSR